MMYPYMILADDEVLMFGLLLQSNAHTILNILKMSCYIDETIKNGFRIF